MDIRSHVARTPPLLIAAPNLHWVRRSLEHMAIESNFGLKSTCPGRLFSTCHIEWRHRHEGVEVGFGYWKRVRLGICSGR